MLPLVEELRLDGSREDLVFNRLTDATLDENGTMYVLDAGNAQVVVVDEAGGLVRTIG
ncbi:MAG: hypothetical protein GWN07_41810, partial [Actinobacteria bacterium]|nr:hypothetical protein [Actinomycetota bacterium]NIX26009.1 hypothetical protein [Actinomycetota bacterium]